MTLIVLDEAELEFLEAVNYYEEAAGLGTRFRDEVSAGVAWILENPRVLRLRPGNCYRFNLRVFPYYLPYIIRGENIWLLAVAQAQRKPRYWIKRKTTIR
jgi:toxin ParE1/3/4